MAEVSSRSRLRIEVDQTLCYGFGDCVDSLPEVFALDGEENKAYVLNPDAADFEDIVEAAQNCPVDAIILTDERGEQVYP
jgi:ferredoxin